MIPRIEDPAGCYCVDCYGPVSLEDEWAFRYFGRCGPCVAKATIEELLDMSRWLEHQHRHDNRGGS